MFAVDRLTPASRTSLVPSPNIPVCCDFDPACLTMSLPHPYNKSVRMDPLASRLPLHVTEYSVTKGSSSFSPGHPSGMDTNITLCRLKQGPRSLEQHTREFLAISHYSDLPDICLIEIFCDGINQPLRERLRREGPRSSLAAFLDFALSCVGSSFTVGVAEEERDNAVMVAAHPAHTMTAAPERDATESLAAWITRGNAMMTAMDSIALMAATAVPIRKMAAASERAHTLAATTELVHKMAAETELHHVTAAVPTEPGQVTVDPAKSSKVTTVVPESSKDTAVSRRVIDLYTPGQVSADLQEPSQTTTDLHDPGQVMIDLHKSSQASASHLKSGPTTGDPHKPSQVITAVPEPSHISSDSPESSHTPPDLPEPRQVKSAIPRSRSVMMASVLDPPLVSVRSANLPVVLAHSGPTSKETLPPAAALPLMAVAIWCVWATHCAPEVTPVPKSAPEVTSGLESAPESLSDLKPAAELSSGLQPAPELPSDHKPAPEVPSGLKSAPEVPSGLKSAPEAFPIGEAAPMPPEVSAPAVEPLMEGALTAKLTASPFFLSAPSVTVLPRSQSMTQPPVPPRRAAALPAPPPLPPWRAPAPPALPPALPWRALALPLAPPWGAPAPPAPPWRATAPPAPPWKAPALLAPPPASPWWAPALSVLPQSPGPPHGPGPPTFVLSRSRPPAPLDCSALWGGGYVMNLVGELRSAHHQMSLSLHYYTQTVALHPGLHLPLSTTLIAPYTCGQSATLYKPRTFTR
ncbi:hypothetical protein M9458_029631 [Cirrhinus mrigala]|uniref:Uncharacterized protein n=1 Tax=Cirrhinus mrigala TaxID=683832 RepID=A0ABD0PHX1_CIRMR